LRDPHGYVSVPFALTGAGLLTGAGRVAMPITVVRSDSAGAVNPNWGVMASVPCAVPSPGVKRHWARPAE
jgi:hypothetical protein